MSPGSRREIVISFRLTPTEYSAIREASKTASPARTPPDWIRAVALKVARHRVPDPPPPKAKPRRKAAADIQALGRVMAALGKIGSNVNQLTKRANSFGRLPHISVLEAIAVDLRAAKDDIRRALEVGHDH